MPIKTSSAVNVPPVRNTQTGSGGCMPVYEDVIFYPGKPTESHVYTVHDDPMHVFGILPEGASIYVERIYMGQSNECLEIPPVPVPCASDVLSGVPGAIVTDFWLTFRGSYKFYYTVDGEIDPTGVIPDDVYVWFMYDDNILKGACCNGC